MKLTLLIIVFVGLLSCSRSNQKQPTALNKQPLAADPNDLLDTTEFTFEDFGKLESYLAKNKINPSLLETIDFDCVILIYPSDKQIDEMKKEYGEEDFYIIADDNIFYQGTAIGIIDSVGIKHVTVTKQFLRLNGKSKTWELDIRKKNLPAWNILFFKTTKEPTIISSIDLTKSHIIEYFK
ncbi:MAG: hypothetical protein KF775_18850 [Cyclobacteriaceae bacterium]|nr:hypothetical protein [Cyclobacteriaceae bacterium]